ncbi:MAG: hypothetical protein ACE5J3_09620 [Methanosarcinales archaeon]
MKQKTNELLGIVTVLLELTRENDKEKVNEILISISMDLIDFARDNDEFFEE